LSFEGDVMECIECGRLMRDDKLEIFGLTVPVKVCPGCGRKLVSPEDAAKLREAVPA